MSQDDRRGRFWDNLIRLPEAQSGIQTAGWTPGPPALQKLGCRVIADQMIPLPDGIELGSDVYLPRQPGCYPAILCFGGYSKELHAAGIPAGTNEVGNPPTFTNRGYAHVIVTRRGMGLSGGKTEVFFNDQEIADFESVIAWVARQPWCDGNVVLFGTSYYACVQPQVAARRPPALRAFFANEMCTDYFRHIVQFGGTPAVYFLGTWTGANFTSQTLRLRLPPLLRALISRVLNSPLKKWWWPWLQRRLPAIMRWFSTRTPIPEVRDIWVNCLVDGKTRATNSIPDGSSPVLEQIEVPFVTIQSLGQFNLHQFGSYELFARASTPADRKWLIMSEPEYEIPVYAWQQEALAFFDFILRGSPNGYPLQPRVRYWMHGANRFGTAEDFPIPGSERVRLYPVAGTDGRRCSVLLERPPVPGVVSWVAIPICGPQPGGLDGNVPQRLSFQYPIEEPVEFSGPITANLEFSCNEIDSYVVARLGRVDVHGHLHLLSLGAISPARRQIDLQRSSATEIALNTGVVQPLTPGQSVQLRFSLTPGPVVLQAGERLQLDVTSRTDLVRSDTSQHHVHFDLHVPPYYSRNTLHCGENSWIELDRIPGNDGGKNEDKFGSMET